MKIWYLNVKFMTKLFHLYIFKQVSSTINPGFFQLSPSVYKLVLFGNKEHYFFFCNSRLISFGTAQFHQNHSEISYTCLKNNSPSGFISAAGIDAPHLLQTVSIKAPWHRIYRPLCLWGWFGLGLGSLTAPWCGQCSVRWFGSGPVLTFVCHSSLSLSFSESGLRRQQELGLWGRYWPSLEIGLVAGEFTFLALLRFSCIKPRLSVHMSIHVLPPLSDISPSSQHVFAHVYPWFHVAACLKTERWLNFPFWITHITFLTPLLWSVSLTDHVPNPIISLQY